jgi:Tol biopolymer transport system component
VEIRLSPDGSRVVFGSQRLGGYDLYEKAVAGDPTETLLLASAEFKVRMDWSPDGRFILYTNFSEQTGNDLWALPLDGDRKPAAVARMPFSEDYGRFSPDGHWIAYESNESGPFDLLLPARPRSQTEDPRAPGRPRRGATRTCDRSETDRTAPHATS